MAVNAQSAKFSLNGLGRSVLTNSAISGPAVDADNTIQKSGVSGYNLFDLQTNLAVDSNFQAMAILRAKSPFGSFFGAATTFEFRQFKMMGNLGEFKYEIGDVRIEMTPFTVYNNYIVDPTYESQIFAQRREIQEYENFNQGNSWLLQGVAGQYFWKVGKEGAGLGVSAFTTRNTATNEVTVPDRLLSGGRLEYRLTKDLIIGANAVSMYDISLLTSDFDYSNNVFTGDISYKLENDDFIVDAKLEGGLSMYAYSEFVDLDTIIDQTDTAYSDGFVDLNVGFTLKEQKLRFDVSGRRVGVLFSSPAAQSRRFNPLQTPNMLSNIEGAARYQSLYDRTTAEELYNSKIMPTMMSYNYAYNRSTPYGKATPNRMGGSLRVGTDTSNHNLDASAKFTYLTEIQGEGTADLRTFMVASGGANVHIGKMLDVSRAIDVNVGARFEDTKRSGAAPVSYASLLVDAGFAVEVLKRIDLLAGMKYISAEGNEYSTVLDGFNLISNFQAFDGKYTETMLSFGARIRFSPFQSFVVNYNLSNNSATDNVTNNTTGYNLGQLFFNYTGRF